jgi:hypothetical protein
MKVWCVFEDLFPWEGCKYDELVRICSTREEAEKWIGENNRGWSTKYKIQEWELDTPNPLGGT